MVVVGLVTMLLWPHELAESDTATGWGLWLGALLGLAMLLVMFALPQLLFGLALRSGARRKLTATAVASLIWVLLGLQPVAGAVVGGWSGLAPLAVVMVAVVSVLDVLVFAVAVRGLRRLNGRTPKATVTPQV